MIDYIIVPKNTMPTLTRMPKGKWIGALNDLNIDEALKLEFSNIKLASSTRNNIHGCFRWARLKRLNLHYKIRSAIIRNSNKTCTLYIWKEVAEDKDG